MAECRQDHACQLNAGMRYYIITLQNATECYVVYAAFLFTSYRMNGTDGTTVRKPGMVVCSKEVPPAPEKGAKP
jgi:hypothetical protein